MTRDDWQGWLVAGVDVDERPRSGEGSLMDRFERGGFGEGYDLDDPIGSFTEMFPKLDAFQREPRLDLIPAQRSYSMNERGRLLLGKRLARSELSDFELAPSLAVEDVKRGFAEVARGLQKVKCSLQPSLWVVFDPGDE